MGLEAVCTVHFGRKSSVGSALLEGERLVFGGEFRVEIAFDQIREVTVEGGTLLVKTAEHEARFDLGPVVADRWLHLIKEPKGLLDKLEVSPHARVAVVDVHDPAFLGSLRERAGIVADGRVPQGAPLVFFGAETRESLRKIPLLRARMADSSVLWVVRPKGTKAIAESDVYEAIRAAGLVDTKVVAFSKSHTAHKCVVPLELRGRGIPRPRFVSLPPSTPHLPGTAGAPRSASKGSHSPPRSSARPAARTKAKKNGATAKGGAKKKRR